MKESHSGLTMTVKSGPRSPAALHVTGSSKPEITIKPAFKLLQRSPDSSGVGGAVSHAHTTPLKVDPSSGALNLSTGSPSPELTSPNSATSPDTSCTRISPAPAPARSPQGYRPPSYNSVELCVVCGDRASGKSTSDIPLPHSPLVPPFSQTIHNGSLAGFVIINHLWK